MVELEPWLLTSSPGLFSLLQGPMGSRPGGDDVCVGDGGMPHLHKAGGEAHPSVVNQVLLGALEDPESA